MPECYTHAYAATQALMRSGHTVASHPGFLAGANGPDVLFMYQAGRRSPQPDLPSLGVRMHHEDTGRFLSTLVSLAATPVQQSYTLGFVCHYIADCTLHPYVAAMSGPGAPYAGRNGFLRMESSIDSTLYYRDYKTYSVPLHAGTPVLITEDLAQVSTLLQEAIFIVYGMSVPQVVLADTFHENMAVRELLTTKSSMQYARARLMETKNRSMGAGFLTSRIQPAPPLKKLPKGWKNPYSGQEMDLTLEEVLALAAQTSGACVAAVMRYWLGDLDSDSLAGILGNNDYYTGLPCHAFDDDAAPLPLSAGESAGFPAQDSAAPSAQAASEGPAGAGLPAPPDIPAPAGYAAEWEAEPAEPAVLPGEGAEAAPEAGGESVAGLEGSGPMPEPDADASFAPLQETSPPPEAPAAETVPSTPQQDTGTPLSAPAPGASAALPPAEAGSSEPPGLAPFGLEDKLAATEDSVVTQAPEPPPPAAAEDPADEPLDLDEKLAAAPPPAAGTYTARADELVVTTIPPVLVTLDDGDGAPDGANRAAAPAPTEADLVVDAILSEVLHQAPVPPPASPPDDGRAAAAVPPLDEE